ncbi:di-trans,poly-cis-decaprenylcistransferase [Hydrogenimonas cancrithermarum]|uniref:Isoprenyl transferase n=1 Tax=Hydrogenimonas cancrithermarum TaxID=2993563 RepID=A0ABN6WSV5_9BACT|nr:di-trans,poly-cis-decaprenylcistransferase [Hydrogenimonas cancrithermarum]BDY12215.1 isoprenyl transferase [Hydrogenimonas cancrithermarum]
MSNIARHIAIIMDGNGRWASERGLKRVKGHERGAETVRTITTYASNHPEIEVLTLYAFSTENWKRPKMEVEFLMRLLNNYLKNELPTYIKHQIRFETIGDLSRFSPTLQMQIAKMKEETRHFKKLTQVLALNYGSQDEIARAAKELCEAEKEITVESLESAIESSKSGPVDILIRTGGEQRLSNFLLWQSAYAELFFTQTLWPDFAPEELETIIENFKKRHRRFGGI